MTQPTLTIVKTHLSPKELAQRWGVHTQTLINWRRDGVGPKFLKLGRRVVYELAEVEKFEAAQRKQNTAQY